MIQPGREAGLAGEALADLVVPGVVVGEQLDRDLSVELQVPGEVDRRHAAVTQPVVELVALPAQVLVHPGSPLSLA